MKPSWELFFDDKVVKIFSEKKMIIDIGGSLRISKEKNNRYEKSHEWIRQYLPKVNYKILDPVADYNPDIVGDIHSLPFKDGEVDAIIAIAIFEHIENPFLATKEIYRSLKNGGYTYLYLPFLYYYHAEKGYYKDYWRFTKDSIPVLFKDFTKIEFVAVRGATETWFKISPLGRFKLFISFGRLIDKITGKDKSNQVSGYNVFLTK